MKASFTRSAAISVAFTTALTATSAMAHYTPKGAITHAPIGVMGDHVHKSGEWMFSYRRMRMSMDGNLVGDNSISTSEILAEGFNMAPTEMTMDMDMFGAMYAVNDQITLMVMIPYIKNEMSMAMEMQMDHGAMGTNEGMNNEMGHSMDMSSNMTMNQTMLMFSEMESSGLGDVKISALYKIETGHPNKRLHLNLGLSLPTGSTDETDVMMNGNEAVLPYAMQLGSGTTDFKPGMTYIYYHPKFSAGAQTLATLRFESNSDGYRLGDQYEISSWIAKDWTPSFSSSFRVKAKKAEKVSGAHERLMPGMSPAAVATNQGGEVVDAIAGINYMFNEGKAKGNRLALELSKPVHQDLNGIQMENDWAVVGGWQLAF